MTERGAGAQRHGGKWACVIANVNPVALREAKSLHAPRTCLKARRCNRRTSSRKTRAQRPLATVTPARVTFRLLRLTPPAALLHRFNNTNTTGTSRRTEPRREVGSSSLSSGRWGQNVPFYIWRGTCGKCVAGGGERVNRGCRRAGGTEETRAPRGNAASAAAPPSGPVWPLCRLTPTCDRETRGQTSPSSTCPSLTRKNSSAGTPPYAVHEGTMRPLIFMTMPEAGR